MNNQFATQYLREDREELKSTISNALQSATAGDEDIIKILTDAVMNGVITLEKAFQIIENPKINEDGVAAAPAGGGGSTTGGGVTNGAGVSGGSEGEQYAAGTRRKRMEESDGEHRFNVGDKVKYNNQDCEVIGLLDWGYRVKGPHFTSNVTKDSIERQNPAVKEDAPMYAHGRANISTYTKDGFTKAPSAQEAGKKIKGVQVKMLWKEGEAPTWEIVKPLVIAIADEYIPRNLHADFHQHIKASLKKNLIKGPQDIFNSASNFLELYREGINESRAYSQFKKQTAIRSKDQQMHEAVKMIHSKLEEVSKLVEFAKQMRNELSEGENTLEYKHNTKKIFEKINSKVVEVYTKTRELK